MHRHILHFVLLGLCSCSTNSQNSLQHAIRQEYIIDSLNNELKLSQIELQKCGQGSYIGNIFISSESNIISLGENYKAHIGNEVVPLGISKSSFVVIDSGDSQIKGDTFWSDKNKSIDIEFTPKLEGIYKLKGRMIHTKKKLIELPFETNYKVE